MPILSFVMPTRSRAHVHVASALVIHASDVDATWRDLHDGRTILLLVCDESRAESVRRLVLSAHAKVEETTPTPTPSPGAMTTSRPGGRRSFGRHRR